VSENTTTRSNRAKRTRNRVSAYRGIVTLHLGPDTFTVPFDETKRLAELSQLCEQWGEDRLAQQLRVIIEGVTCPFRGKTPLERISEIMIATNRLEQSVWDNTISSEDSKIARAIIEFKMKRC
jgi:hypothetical protein